MLASPPADSSDDRCLYVAQSNSLSMSVETGVAYCLTEVDAKMTAKLIACTHSLTFASKHCPAALIEGSL